MSHVNDALRSAQWRKVNRCHLRYRALLLFQGFARDRERAAAVVPLTGGWAVRAGRRVGLPVQNRRRGRRLLRRVPQWQIGGHRASDAGALVIRTTRGHRLLVILDRIILNARIRFVWKFLRWGGVILRIFHRVLVYGAAYTGTNRPYATECGTAGLLRGDD